MKQIRKPFNIVMTLIILIVVTVITIAFSSWLITDEIKEKPTYESGTLMKYFFDGKFGAFNGLNQAPESPLFDESEITYQHKKTDETEYIDGKPTNAGEYDIRIIIKENSEIVDVKYEILPKQLDDKFSVEIVGGDKFQQLGTAITPEITLVDSDISTTLKNGIDYTLSYENNILAGTAKIIITGIGNYQGTITQEFTIVGTGKLEVLCTNMQQLTYNGTSQAPEYTIKCGSDTITDAIVEIQYKDLNTGEYINDKPKHAGIYSIRISAKKEGYEDSDVLETKVTINPKEITVTWESLSFTYNGQIQKPTGTLTGLIDGDSCVLSISADDNKNAGTYIARATIGSGENMADYKISNASTQYVIGKKDIRVSDAIVEVDYKSGLTWANLKEQLAGMVSYDGLISGDTLTAEVKGMHNGIIGYGTNEKTTPYTIAKLTGSTSYTNIIGSTYLVTISVSDSELTNYNLQSNTFIFKYKTAILGTSTSKYYTVEDAFSQSGDINFVGDSTGKTSFVTTSFCNLSIGEGYPYSEYTYTVSNRKLVVPCKNEYLSNLNEPTTGAGSSGNVYSALVVGDKIQINVGSSGNLLIDGELGFAQPKTTIVCSRGVLLNLGTINIKTGSKVYSYGFFKGLDNGFLELESGSEAKECFITYDWPGGNTATSIYKKVLPLNAWSLHNISCTTKINHGANYWAHMYAEMNGGSTKISTSMYIIRSDTNESCMFISKDGYILKSTISAREKPTDTSLVTITGSNQAEGQKDIVEMYGEYADSSFQINVDGNKIVTSKTIACPIGYMDITVKSGSQLVLANSDYLFLPGTTLTIDENAVLTTNSDIDLSFEILTNINKVSGSYAFSNKCIDKFDAKMVVNGTFNCNGGIGGLITTSNLNGKIKFGSTSKVYTTFLSLYNGVNLGNRGYTAYKVSNFYGKAYINDVSSYSVFVENNEYTAAITSDGKYYWVGVKGTITSFDGTFDSEASEGKISCLVEGTLITLADGTKKRVEDLEIGDILLVFNHETGRWDYMPLLVNVHAYQERELENVINLTFDDGTTLRIVGEHGLFDVDLNEYVYINEDNFLEFINHRFVATTIENGEIKTKYVTLINTEITSEFIKVYNPASVWHLNLVANDVLTLSAGMVNFFEYDENMKYVEESMQRDIEKYGLYTYDDFAEYVSEEVFNAFPFKYFKVAVGKGLITYEDILELIEFYNSSNSIK